MKPADGDGLLVGIEVHQQLDLRNKLFCACPPLKSEEFPTHFERRLRPAQSETGRVDPAAVFEYSKGKSNLYFWNPESSCLVEADEEPPHPLSTEGLRAALLTSKTLRAKVVDEIHVMRKIVIDGSNTAGFQRTAVVGVGGEITVDGTRVGVQSVTLEEDAARILGEDDASRMFALDRLGVALIEIALDPIRGDPEFVGRVALHLGRVLRSTGEAARGLGTIRQDLNVSLQGGRVVEVKGVQRLNLVPKVVEYERKRHRGLMKVAESINTRHLRRRRPTSKDVTSSLSRTSSRALAQQVAAGGKIACILAPGLGSLMGWEPEPGIRLGKELAEVARANFLGGIVHSDEFSKQGVSDSEASALRRLMGSSPDDAMVLVAGRPETVDRVVGTLIARIEASADGVPAETRAATDTGETRYMRPRPGSQRMYPETDIPDIVVSDSVLEEVAREVPEPWEEKVARLATTGGISRDLALKLYDAELDLEFEGLVGRLKVEPSVVASVLVDLPPRLTREGVPEEELSSMILADVLTAVSDGRVAKEAIPDVLKYAALNHRNVIDAIRGLGLEAASEDRIRAVVKKLVAARAALLRERGDAAFSPLMGEVMRELRGKADGAAVARALREEIQKTLK